MGSWDHSQRFAAVIFDLDGVLVRTDELHYQAWAQLAGQYHIPFDRGVNRRLRGVSRAQSLEILLLQSRRFFTRGQQVAMAEQKNAMYVQLLENLGPQDLLPGVSALLERLESQHVRLAVASSSRNARLILAKVGLLQRFEVIVDGGQVTHGKPDPEIFLLAARQLGVEAAQCLVVEDAEAGVGAARSAKMAVLALAEARRDPRATWRALDLSGANELPCWQRLRQAA